MDIGTKAAILQRANANMRKIFPKGPLPLIKMSDIEAVYDRNVLGIATDAKTRKGIGAGYLTGIMYLAPTDISGVNMCPMASQGCKAACLFTAGRGAFQSVTRARVIKTLAYHFDKPRFIDTLKKSIRSLITQAKNKGMTPVVRLNGTSDIVWERVSDVIQSFPDTQFYDYTKIAKRFLWDIPSNYHLTFSISESNSVDARLVLSRGGNVAAVFRKDIPASLWSYPTVNGDATDLRFLDARGVVVGLKAKGKAKRDTTGFVIDPPQAAREAA